MPTVGACILPRSRAIVASPDTGGVAIVPGNLFFARLPLWTARSGHFISAAMTGKNAKHIVRITCPAL
ncbi:MAG: hypothetical protein ACC631_08240 [Halocynthiibacter sp.]